MKPRTESPLIDRLRKIPEGERPKFARYFQRLAEAAGNRELAAKLESLGKEKAADRSAVK